MVLRYGEEAPAPNIAGNSEDKDLREVSGPFS